MPAADHGDTGDPADPLRDPIVIFGFWHILAATAFTTDNNFPESPGQPTDIEKYHVSTLGDIELTGMYTGFTNDMSKGLIFGLKLPTGDWRAYQIGAGSTDLVLGGFWRGLITGDNAWQYFAQTKFVQPLFTHSQNVPAFGSAPGDYRPGMTLDAALGVTYNNWHFEVSPRDDRRLLNGRTTKQNASSHRREDSLRRSLRRKQRYRIKNRARRTLDLLPS